MRFGLLAAAALLLSASTALAGRGDWLLVTADAVNVRARPALDAPVLLKVGRDQPALELLREGEWVRVVLPAHRSGGWIHASLVGAPAAAAPPHGPSAPGRENGPAASRNGAALSPAASGRAQEVERALQPVEAVLAAVDPLPVAAGPAPAQLATELAALERFRASVAYLDGRAAPEPGRKLFAGVRGRGDGTAEVVATDLWGSLSADKRASCLDTLFDRWLAASSGAGPLRVDVVDRAGAVLMSRARP